MILALGMLITGCGQKTVTDTSNDIPLRREEHAKEEEAEKDAAGTYAISDMTDTEIVFSDDLDPGFEQELTGEEDFSAILISYQELYQEDASEEDYIKANRNPLTRRFVSDEGNAAMFTIGYALIDMEGNGKADLLIGVNCDTYKGTVILGLYVQTEKGAVLICSSSEDSIYYLGQNNRIYYKATTENGEKYYYKYELQNAQLERYYELAYTEQAEMSEPWIEKDGDEKETISVDQAKEMAAAFYEELQIAELQSFDEQ